MVEEYEFGSLQEHEVFFCIAPKQTSEPKKLLAQGYKSHLPTRKSGRNVKQTVYIHSGSRLKFCTARCAPRIFTGGRELTIGLYIIYV